MAESQDNMASVWRPFEEDEDKNEFFTNKGKSEYASKKSTLLCLTRLFRYFNAYSKYEETPIPCDKGRRIVSSSRLQRIWRRMRENRRLHEGKSGDTT